MRGNRRKQLHINKFHVCAGAAGILVGSLSGCHSSSEPAPSATIGTPDEKSSTASPPEDRQLPHRPAVKPVAQPLTVDEKPADEPTRSPEQQQALQLFDRLVTPGLEASEWESVHQQLLLIGPDAVPVLAERLSQGTPLERETATTLLLLLGPDATNAADALIGALDDPSTFVRANAAAALVQFPEQRATAVPVLVSLLESEDPQLQQLAAMNLNTIGMEAEQHVVDLQRVLSVDHPPEVLVPVVELLGRIGPAATSAVPKLQQIAFEQSGEVGRAANTAIQQIKATDSESPPPVFRTP